MKNYEVMTATFSIYIYIFSVDFRGNITFFCCRFATWNQTFEPHFMLVI